LREQNYHKLNSKTKFILLAKVQHQFIHLLAVKLSFS